MTPQQEKLLRDLDKALRDLRDEFYRNNFPSSQDYFKYIRFNGRLKVPHYDSLPTTCEVGEIAESGGKLRVCSSADTWSIVGTQS